MKNPRDIFSQFSPQAKQILATSQKVAEGTGRGIGSEHLLIALAITPQTIAHEILTEYAINLEQIKLVLSLNNLWTRVGRGLSAEMKQILKVALRLAAEFRHEQIEPEHLLLTITRLRDIRAYQIIARVGVDPEHLRGQLETILGHNTHLQMIIEPEQSGSDDEPIHDHNQTTEGNGSVNHDHHHHPFLDMNFESHRLPAARSSSTQGSLLDAYTTDLVALAKAGKLDPLIGREPELRRLVHILARRTKNNPVLIGEPGIGKTAIVEGLATRIVEQAVPTRLANHRILRLDLTLLVAGTMYRGQFEERIKRLMEEVQKNSKIILFIDELQTLVGAGGAEGALDASNILKPALARGDLRLIGATTLADFRKQIERDAALERRFQPIYVTEPTTEESRAILSGLKDRYETFHGVTIANEALDAAIDLSTRYLHDRTLPDKAIDLIDEAAAAVALSQRNEPEAKVRELTQKLAALIVKKDHAIERTEFSAATTIRRQETSLRATLNRAHAALKEQRPIVDRNDIARLVASWSNIPLAHLIAEERANILDLDLRLGRRVLGQNRAISLVVAAIKRATTGLSAAGRPLGSFLFLGPTGVGKTELARQLAREVFGSPDAFIKLDMSEFSQPHTIARLVGAPAGYVGYEDGGKLTDAVRRRPYALILLDEIEKAHPDFQNLLLQILEDGVLTDAKGRRISFAHTIIIMTSNLGSQEFGHVQALGFETSGHHAKLEEQYQELSDRVTAQVREFFTPEFLNRLEAMIIFEPLRPAIIEKITDLALIDLENRLTRDGYQLSVSSAARRHLARTGFDAEFGARPIRRLITNVIETPIADLILSERIRPGGLIIVDQHKNEIVVSIQNKTKLVPRLAI